MAMSDAQIAVIVVMTLYGIASAGLWGYLAWKEGADDE
jgi:hypothetical protein